MGNLLTNTTYIRKKTHQTMGPPRPSNRPITIKDDKGNTSECIADIVPLFIILMDKLRLEIKATDQLHPDLRDLMDTMNRLSILPSDFDGKLKVPEWLQPV
ncbi:hypothetical protein QAD02_012943 [Eretmocerus hayati]|uniref:Uncharacterized protein n=1 Tax=Eretmocerus hayati TaxID=131215 RepID=A0ACC2P2X1_9HYME|nr:hypothetical protein QAD02_012943 [Eretmocerus hayati]